MNKFLLAVFVTSVCLMLCCMFDTTHHKAIYLDEDSVPVSTVSKIPPQYKPIIDEINNRNTNIKTYQCDIRCEIQHKLFVKISGKLLYEKPRSSRLIFDSLLGTEADLGSNKDRFWFWSKKMQPKGLYYASHEDLWKTRLKPGLNPLWMVQSLTLDVIDTVNTTFDAYNGNLLLRKQDIGTNGEPVSRLTLIDKEKRIILGNYLFDKNNKLISSMEVTEFNGLIPKVMLIIWQDPMGQRVSLKWSMYNQVINDTISINKFQMPTSYSPLIDMGKD